ncbi:MAG: preprotein translocase subunit SecE [Planctomycetota bacterium]|jgi:preprotein translocase SecE subunit
MEIYKRGQGVWARGLAIVLFLLFAGWGVYEIYRLPAELNVILQPDEPIWEREIHQLLEAGINRPSVKGLANQPLTEELLKPGYRPARRIEDSTGHGIVLESETFDNEKLKACEEAGIRYVPVLLNDQPVDTVPVDEWLVGKSSAAEVKYGDTIRLVGTKDGEPLDEALLTRIRELLKEFPNAVSGPFYKTKEDWKEKKNPTSLPVEDLAIGLVPGATPLITSVQRLALGEGELITREIFDNLKPLAEGGKIPGGKVRILDEGTLVLDAGNLDEIKGRYLIAMQSEERETWWNRTLFTVPLVNLDGTPGILICLGLYFVLALALLYSWNFKRWNDLLIETQTEMKKVSWPKRDELIGSSVVVIVCVFVLGVYLYFVDILLTTLADRSGLLR